MINYIKNLSKEEISVYIGCIITIILAEFIKYGWIFIIFNVLFFISTSLFIIKISNIVEFNKNFNKLNLNKIEDLGVLVIFSLFGIGTIVGLYDLYSFYKNPITKKYDTKEQYERDKKLKNLGI